MIWMRLALRDLMKNRGFVFFFILNLSLGLAGFIAIHSFGNSLNRHFNENLKEILTADLVLSSNTPLTPEELKLVNEVLGHEKVMEARRITFYTMVRVGANARLIQVRAIDVQYPLYGAFSLKGGFSNSEKQDIQKRPGVFMTGDAARAIGIRDQTEVNTPLVIGNKTFFIKDLFLTDPDRSFTSLEFAPRVYMGIGQLKGTGLIQFGSRIRYSHYYRFSRAADVPGLAEKLRLRFSEKYPGQPRVRIYDSRDVNEGLGRITRYFTGFMGLVSVVALFLAGIATAYLFRGYLRLKQKEIAILMTIGGRPREIYFYISFQLMILGALASFLAVFFSLFLFPAFSFVFRGLIPGHVLLSMDAATISIALVMGMAGSLVFCLPVFVRLFGIKPLILLRGNRARIKKGLKPILWQMASFLPGLAAFFLFSFFVAGSVKNGGIFATGFALALIFLSALGWLIFSCCRILSTTRHLMARIAFRNLFRNQWSSLSCFVTIAMGVFLISLIPGVQQGLQKEITRPKGLKIPVFFLVDIQEEQKTPLVEFIKKQDAELTNLSPMVRGRILTVNHQPFYDENRISGIQKSGSRHSNLNQRSGSGQSDSRRQRRGRRLEFNFSFRKSLDVSETIVKGSPLSETPWVFGSKIPFEISVEKNFAERHNLNPGDIVAFEIQGIPLTGKVKNLRKVRWNSFQPNFFLLFQNGVLNDAPKTFLAAISNVARKDRQELKNRIVNEFPNVSVIDVTRMAGTLLSITDRLSLSISFMAWLAMGVGMVSIFSIARHEAWKNENQVNLLKVLGADFKMIRAITLMEFGFIGFTAAFFAILLSFGFSLAISWYFFDSLWQFDLKISVVILFMTTVICMATALMASRKVMNSKPVKLLTDV